MPKHRDYVPTNRLAELRKAANLTLREVAERANTSIAQVHKLEIGERMLDLHWMQRLALALGCTPADLLLPQDGGLDPKERELVETVRTLPEPQGQMFYSLMETQQAYRAPDPASDPVRLIPRKRHRAA